MIFADLDVRYPGSQARWYKSSCRNRDQFKTLIGKNLPSPPAYAAADKNHARKAHSRTRYQAREAKRDPEGEENGPRRTCRHLDGLTCALVYVPKIHHDSPPDEVHDCKHNDPHRIYKMPIESYYAKAFALPRTDPTEQGEDERRA